MVRRIENYKAIGELRKKKMNCGMFLKTPSLLMAFGENNVEEIAPCDYYLLEKHSLDHTNLTAIKEPARKLSAGDSNNATECSEGTCLNTLHI